MVELLGSSCKITGGRGGRRVSWKLAAARLGNIKHQSLSAVEDNTTISYPTLRLLSSGRDVTRIRRHSTKKPLPWRTK